MAGSLRITSLKDLRAMPAAVRKALGYEEPPAEEPKAGKPARAEGPWNPANPNAKTMLRQRLIAASQALDGDDVAAAKKLIADAIQQLTE